MKAPQIADGFIQADVLLETTTSSIYAILVYRTGYAAFGNTQGCFAYRVALSSTTIYLERGQNNASGGSVTTIDSAAVSIGTTTPSVVRVRFSGSSHRVWVDDELVIDATDATYTAAGCIGLGAQSDSGTVSVSRFDNLSIFTN